MVVDPREAAREAPLIGAGGPGEQAGAPIRQASLWRDAWRRYVKNRGAVLAASVFVLLVLYCVFAPVFSPYDPDEVNFSDAYLGSAATCSLAPRSGGGSRSGSASGPRSRSS